MPEKFARVIIDISHEKVDRPFSYAIPQSLEDQIKAGCRVRIPFGSGNKERTGYVVGVSCEAGYDRDKVKPILGLVKGSITAESQLIELAWWMKERYGSTMNQALKTVLPVKQKVKGAEKKYVRCLLSPQDLQEARREAQRKKYRARLRLLEAFSSMPVIPYEAAVHQLGLTAASLKPLEDRGIIAIEKENVYRDPAAGIRENTLQKNSDCALAAGQGQSGHDIGRPRLNPEQQAIVQDFCLRYDGGERGISLIHGITGSGKTEVYMELIDHVRSQGKEVIVLIPEIALTYQTVMRFYKRFGQNVSFINSRLSAGERYDQFERAKKKEISIMIGPRSALFTPFKDLGLIIIDEEHEGAYKSDSSPRYHARDAAAFRAGQTKASLVLGSATPSVDSYERALRGEYRLYTLTQRAKKDSRLAKVYVVDLREELKEGNKSIFSRLLQEMMEDRLRKGQQMMLFMNRRGYSSFISCRSCGEAVKCPHCDVTLTLHRDGRMMCHYCGYTTKKPAACPSCGSPYIAGFGTGTQKIQAMVEERFPGVSTLRMDLDTTSKKGGHEEILSAFGAGEAQILIGTQMIVKGHDFPNVTLVGVLAADTALYAPDFKCGERTFQLLTQAAGRAGRDNQPGDVVIQTYSPDHYSIQAAANQNYQMFFEREASFRRMLRYPPFCGLLTIQVASGREDALESSMGAVDRWTAQLRGKREDIWVIGPVQAPVYKVNDIYRKILYLKSENYDILIQIRNRLEELWDKAGFSSGASVQYDFT